MAKDLKKIVFINTITNYIFLFWRMATAIFITRIIFFGLGEEYYGFWALLWTVFGYALLLDFGFGKSIQKFTAEVTITKDFNKYNRLISSIILAYSLMAFAIILFSIFCGYYLEHVFSVKHLSHLEYCKNVFMIFGIGVALVFPTGFLPEILMGLKRTDLKNYFFISAYTLKVVGIYVLFKLDCSLMALAVVTVSANLIQNLSLYFVVRKLLPEFRILFRSFKFKYLKEVGSFSFYAYLYAIAVMILFRTDAAVLGVMVGMMGVGIYQLGTRISIVMEQITTQFQSNLPAIAASLHKNNETEKLKWILLKSSRISTYISTGIFVGLFFLTRQIMYLWLEVKNEDVILIAYIMITSTYIMVLFRSSSIKFLQMAGEHKKVGCYYLIESAVNIILSVSLVHLMGVIGVALGTIIPNIIFSVFIFFPMFAKFSNFTVMYYLKKVYLPIIITVLPTVVFLFIINSNLPPYQWTILDLVGWSLLAGLIYLLMGFFFYFTKEEKKKYVDLIPVSFVRKILGC